MTDRGGNPAQRAFPDQVCRCDGGDDCQRPNTSRHLADLLQYRPSLAEQHLLRWCVAAMLRAIDQRPESAGIFGLLRLASKQASFVTGHVMYVDGGRTVV